MPLSKTDVKKLLQSDAFIARVIRDTADIDWEISLILVRFYTAQERFYEFSENIIDRFSFAQKIDILRKLRLPKKFKSQVSAVSVCEKLRKIRNVLAHSSYVPDESLDRLWDDKDLRVLLQGYPMSYTTAVRHTKLRLNRLYVHYLAAKRKTKA